jgi:hypothetical protein
MASFSAATKELFGCSETLYFVYGTEGLARVLQESYEGVIIVLPE